MLTIRHATVEDHNDLIKMHHLMRLNYELPMLCGPGWALQAVLESDQIELALLGRKTAELYLLAGNAGTGRDRIGKILALRNEGFKALREAGYQTAHANLPPEMEKSFGRHLLQHGWQKLAWPEYEVNL